MADSKTKAKIEIEANVGSAIKAFEGLLANLEKLEETIAPTTKKVTLMGKAFERVKAKIGDLGKRFPRVAKAVAGINKALKLTRRVLGGAVTGVKKVVGAANRAKDAFGSWNNSIQLINTSMGWLSSAIGSVFGVITSGIEKIREANPFDPIILRLDHLRGKMDDLLRRAVRPILEAFLRVSSSLDPIIKKVGEIFSKNNGKTARVFEQTFVNIGNIVLRSVVPGLRLVTRLFDKGTEALNKWALSDLDDQIGDTAAEINKLNQTTKALGNTFRTIELNRDELEKLDTLRKTLKTLEEQRAIQVKINADAKIETPELLEALAHAQKALDAAGPLKLKTEAELARPAPIFDFMANVQRALDSSAIDIDRWGQTWVTNQNKFQEYVDGLAGGIDITKLVNEAALETRLKEAENAFKALEAGLKRFNFAGRDVEGFRKTLEPLAKLFPSIGKGWRELLAGMDETVTFEQRNDAINKFTENLLASRDVSTGELDFIKAIIAEKRAAYDGLIAKRDEDAANAKENTDKLKALQQESLNFWTSQAASLGSAISNGLSGIVSAYGAIGDIAEDSEIRIVRAQQGITMAIYDSVAATVTALAVEAAVKYASSVASATGVFAAIAAPIALGAMFGLFRGWINSHFEGRVAVQEGAKAKRLDREKLVEKSKQRASNYDSGSVQYMSGGGFVRGGVANEDSVKAMLMPGEYVLNKRMVEGLTVLSRDLGAGFRGIQPAARSESSTVTNTITNNNEFVIEVKTQQLPNKTDTKKWVQSTILPALKQLQAGGF